MIPQRITERIDKSGDCWKWGGAHTGRNRDRPEVMFEGRMWYVYRLLYTHMIGPIPDGVTLDHVVCDNPWCCNPFHCKPASRRANTLRALEARYAGRTACPKGHAYAEYRMYRRDGKAYCGECNRVRSQRWRSLRDHQ